MINPLRKLIDTKLNKALDAKLGKMGFTKTTVKQDQDVYIIGYPKSGTTLVKVLVGYMAYGITTPVDINLMHQLVTEEYKFKYYQRFGERHYFKNHELPDPKYKNVIYVIRDGRDALLSYYHMRKNMNRQINIEEFYKNGGKTPFGTWSEHVSAWQENPYKARIIFVKYEDLLKAKEKEIERLASFLNIEDFNAASLCHLTSFESMRKMEQSFGWAQRKKINGFKKDTFFVRSGKVGEAIESVPESVLQSFNSQNYKLLSYLNYQK